MIKHTYILDGTKILKETWNSNVLAPLYNNEDSVCGISYNGSTYYFVKNLQGDIVAIANASKAIVARYTYYAWGVCTVMDADGNENTTPSFIGKTHTATVGITTMLRRDSTMYPAVITILRSVGG